VLLTYAIELSLYDDDCQLERLKLIDPVNITNLLFARRNNLISAAKVIAIRIFFRPCKAHDHLHSRILLNGQYSFSNYVEVIAGHPSHTPCAAHPFAAYSAFWKSSSSPTASLSANGRNCIMMTPATPFFGSIQ